MKYFIFFMFSAFMACAQIDSAIRIPLVGVHFGGQLPMADLNKRFGPNLVSGLSFTMKSKKNWLYGARFDYMYGRNVKEDVLKSLKTPEGYVVDNAGFPADLRVSERATAFYIFGGKVLPLASANPNSGLMVTLGAGYLEHKINLYDAQKQIAAIKDNLKYGYDRLSVGFSVSQFVGYLFLSENRMLNFYFGVDCSQSFTKSVRKVNYDTGLSDTGRRLDILTGLRFGWILPLYKKTPNDFYYN
jgi:hypothetical protein